MNLIAAERKLLIFPGISCVAMILLICMIFAGNVTLNLLAPEAMHGVSENQASIQLLLFALYAVVYLTVMFVSNFCLTAFYCEIFKGMNGESVSVRRGFEFAASRWKAIFLWSLLAATVGLILRMLEERFSLLGKIVTRLVGMAWAVSACFAIPALVCDPELENPMVMLKRSVSAIKRTWGEALIGFAGLNLISGVATFIWIVTTIFILVLSAFSGSTLCMALGGILATALFIVLLFFAYLVNAAQSVYTAALYRYAEYGDAGIFSQEELESAFKHKKR